MISGLCFLFLLFPFCSALSCNKCSNQQDLSQCSTTVVCGGDEVCYWTIDQGTKAATLGCKSKTNCDPGSGVIGKRSGISGCCNTDNLAPVKLAYQNLTTSSSSKQIHCHLCRGPKFICERSHAPVLCPSPDQQYCINDIENLIDGSRYVSRRCATESECLKDWIQGSSDRNECIRYGERLVDAHFYCSFCCKGENCNHKTVPENLYHK